jgi:Rne/Rng family ribonuclease
MSKELVISATPHETRVAIVEDGQLCEIYIEREREFALVGSLYKGRVTRVLPGMQSAFVDIGLDSDAFLYVSDFLEHLEDYDHVPNPVATNVQKVEQHPGEAFAPSTNSGAPQEPSITAAPPSDAIAGAASPLAETGPSALPDAGAQSLPPAQHTERPYEKRPNRGRGGFNDRGGRHRRWGRRGGGRRSGHDLPSAKYASPRPFDSRPRESQPYELPPSDFVPVILPGESLAKYKDRIPAAPAVLPAEAAAGSTPPRAEPLVSTAKSTSPESAAGVPDSLYTSSLPGASVMEEYAELLPAPSIPAEEAPEVTPVSSPPLIAEPETHHEPEREPAAVAEIQSHNGAVLSDDEISAFAEQLAEAKHEEAQAEAEEREEVEEVAAESFVDAAELGDLQDALHEDHEAEAAEAEATADEMHDQALSAESSTEPMDTPDGEQHPPEAPQDSEAQPKSARISDQTRARFQRPMRRGWQQGGGRRGGRPNAHRPHQHSHPSSRHEHHGRPQLISEMLKAGQEIIVQIAKEPLGKKGARITSHVALPGRFLVYMPTVDHIGVSRRIGSAEDRSRLRRVVTEAKGTFPGGFIVRTAAADATDEEIRTDVEFLGRSWDTIRANAEQRHAPSLLHRDLNLVERILRDYLSDDYVAIWLDNEEEFSKVVDFVGRFQPKLVGRVKLYIKESPIFEEFGIQQELDKALRPKVWLKSGGHIVINHTEALVAIDINTGKYVGRGSTRLEDTIVKTNLEAVKEIVRQIRLRDLGGIIVVDFIDMEERRNRDKVMAALDQALTQDRAPSKALSFNEFGLVCITRKRTKQALERVLCQPCPYCTGSGMVKSIPTICYEIQAEARKMAADLDAQSITLRVNPEIAKTLKTRESSLIEELEQSTHKNVIIQSDPTLHWEQYDIY